jgi:pentatricopeptide repeat protein
LRFTLPSQGAGRPLSLATANRIPKKLENGDKSSFIAEELVDAFTDDAAGSRLRLNRQKSPQEVQQLRFSRHIENLVKKGRVGEAHEVFQQMKQAQVQPNVFVFNLLIAGYGRKGDVRTCFKLFNEVSPSGGDIVASFFLLF